MSGASGSWRTVVTASLVLSFALLGDALIYAVLPVYAASFGISLAMVGILLSANRFVRVFAYGAVATLTYKVGSRRMCIVAAILAVLSTAIYGIGQGFWILLIGRILWGVTYAILLLVTLDYAVEFRKQAGTRVGVSVAIQRTGPIIALLGGAWLTGLIGPTTVFLVLAGISVLAIPLAMSLPARRDGERQQTPPKRLGRPYPVDLVFFLLGFGVDGVFAISIALIFAQDSSAAVAVMSGGAILAMRHLAGAVAAPIFGWASDRFGARRVFITSAVLTIIGFACIAAGFTVIGAVAMLIFRGALASLGPAIIVDGLAEEDSVIGPLARMQAWRDLGAAVGPLTTGFALAFVSAQFLHGAVAALLVLGLAYWMRAPKTTP
jgi:predicted MFS family arabinose efflux permease